MLGFCCKCRMPGVSWLCSLTYYETQEAIPQKGSQFRGNLTKVGWTKMGCACFLLEKGGIAKCYLHSGPACNYPKLRATGEFAILLRTELVVSPLAAHAEFGTDQLWALGCRCWEAVAECQMLTHACISGSLDDWLCGSALGFMS